MPAGEAKWQDPNRALPAMTQENDQEMSDGIEAAHGCHCSITCTGEHRRGR